MDWRANLFSRSLFRPPAPGTRSSTTRIAPKLEKFNRSAAIEDHRHHDTFRRRVRGSENLFPLHRGLKIVHFERYVGDGFD